MKAIHTDMVPEIEISRNDAASVENLLTQTSPTAPTAEDKFDQLAVGKRGNEEEKKRRNGEEKKAKR